MQNTFNKARKKGRKKERKYTGRITSDMWVYAQICEAARLLAIEPGIANK
jgi:hypothetical protein